MIILLGTSVMTRYPVNFLDVVIKKKKNVNYNSSKKDGIHNHNKSMLWLVEGT